MTNAPTALELSTFMLGSASTLLLLMLSMRWIAVRFLDGDESKLNDYVG